jgi:hypothetical protein
MLFTRAKEPKPWTPQRVTFVSRSPGFYLAKPYLCTSPNPVNGLAGCASGLFTVHDLSDIEGRVQCFLGNVEGVKYDYIFNSTCVACGAGKSFVTSGM